MIFINGYLKDFFIHFVRIQKNSYLPLVDMASRWLHEGCLVTSLHTFKKSDQSFIQFTEIKKEKETT